MRLKFKITTEGLRYPMDIYSGQIIKKILVLLILVIFLYLCITNCVKISFILSLLLIYGLIIFYRIINYLIMHMFVSKIESMHNVESKRKFLLSLNKLYHRLNIFCYFINSNVEIFINFRRWLFDRILDLNSRTVLFDCFLFLFYYPILRLHLCLIISCNAMKRPKSFNSSFEDNLKEIFMVVMLFWPIIGIGFVDIKLISFIYLLCFMIVFPIINLFHNNDWIILQYNDLYPTTYYILEQRAAVHVLNQIIKLYPYDVIFDIKPLVFQGEKSTLTVSIAESCVDKILFYPIGIYNLRPAVFYKYYMRLQSKVNMQYYLENNKFISYIGYQVINDYILNNWRHCYLWKFLYEQALIEKVDIAFGPDLMIFFDDLIMQYNETLGESFKLLWDIEKDGGLDLITVKENTNFASSDLVDYKCKIYKDFGKVKANEQILVENMDSIWQAYRDLIASSAIKNFDNVLEDKIFNCISTNYVYVEFIKRFFEDNGWYLVKDASLFVDDEGEEITLHQPNKQCMLKKQAYSMVMNCPKEATNEIQHLINNNIRKNADADIKKWRQEGKRCQ